MNTQANRFYTTILSRCLITMCMSILLSGFTPTKSYASDSPGITTNGTSIKQALTTEDFEGSTAQSTALLNLVENNPGYTDYQVSKALADEVIVFGCNMEKMVLIRIHQRRNGTGTQEMWRDHIIYRLNASRGGGSLNDTPQGKIPGSMQSF